MLLFPAIALRAIECSKILQRTTSLPFPGPAVVVMLKDGCPCAKECHIALNALAHACRGKIKFVGLLDADEPCARSLAKEADLAFPVLADPERSLIWAFKGHAALDIRLLGPDGRIVEAWNGLDRANVAALVAAVQAWVGKDVALSLDPFTVLPQIGCVFGLNDPKR